MLKNIVKVLTVVMLVGVLFGAFDVVIAPATSVSGTSSVVTGFAVAPLGVVQSVSAECDDGEPGCD